jgi:alkylation response protein AidB-like acyl-CoA dehydrogenase
MSNAIEFSEEQAMLLETAMDFCSNKSAMSKVRKSIEEPTGFDQAQWQEMTGLGWLGIAIPEQYGGLGLGLGDVVPIVESMGRYLMGSPFLATTLAAQALVANGTDSQKSEWLPAIAAGSIASLALSEEDGNWDLSEVSAKGAVAADKISLSGKKTFVLDAVLADIIVTSINYEGRSALALIEKTSIPDGNIQREIVIDETRRSYQLTLDGIEVSKNNLLATADFSTLENAALLLLSAEMAGGLAGVLNVIVDYLNTRKQFDRLIGSYQALKHPTAEILLSLEAAKSHVYHAATLSNLRSNSGESGHKFEIALRMAKAHSSEAFAYAGDRAVQFHGGFGFTYECDAQLYLRRALWCQYQYGDERYHRQKLAPLLID